MKRFFYLLFASCLFTSVTQAQTTQAITSKQIDSLVALTLKTFDVPGIAVGVIKDGKLIHAKGYGIANLRTGKKVDEYTLFGIASNSKSYAKGGWLNSLSGDDQPWSHCGFDDY